MGAPLGGGRTEKFGYITDLRQSEVEVLKALFNWNHQKQRANYRAIANKCNISTSAVSNALWYLKSRGMVSRSSGRSWHIIPKIKEQLIQEFGQTESGQSEEQVQSEQAPQS